MKIVYLHTAYKPGDLIGTWFAATRDFCRKSGGDAWIAVKFSHHPASTDDIVIGDSLSCGLHARIYQLTGLQDMFSWWATRRFLRRLDEIRPDIIHCHVVNDLFLDLRQLFAYATAHNIRVVWTFHDMRALTGQCPYPGLLDCGQWRLTCHCCPVSDGPLAPVHPMMNCVGVVHDFRKNAIGRLSSQHLLTVVTPSRWLARQVAVSHLSGVRCEVIPNGIDPAVFRPVESQVREKYGIGPNERMLLAVGNPIGYIKGRDYLLRLANDLPDGFRLVMVGCLPADVDALRSNAKVIALGRVPREELVQFYTAADLLVNPTLADNFPTVNLEAQACGCPVVAFDSDGTPETVASRGVVVPRLDYDAWRKAIVGFGFGTDARVDAISFAARFRISDCMEQYFRLYENLLAEV